MFLFLLLLRSIVLLGSRGLPEGLDRVALHLVPLGMAKAANLRGKGWCYSQPVPLNKSSTVWLFFCIAPGLACSSFIN